MPGSDGIYRYIMPDAHDYLGLAYKKDGTFYSYIWSGLTSDCGGKSITQLYEAGLAFDLVHPHND